MIADSLIKSPGISLPVGGTQLTRVADAHQQVICDMDKW